MNQTWTQTLWRRKQGRGHERRNQCVVDDVVSKGMKERVQRKESKNGSVDKMEQQYKAFLLQTGYTAVNKRCIEMLYNFRNTQFEPVVLSDVRLKDL